MSKEPSIKVRLFLFPIIGLLFIIICVVLAISAFGYNLKYENGHFMTERTGMIILASRPGDAKIYLDGKPYKSRTSYIYLLTTNIGRLPLGEHTIKVEKDGYETWEGVFNVEPNIVAWGNYILLIPKERTTTPFSFSGNVTGTITSTDRSRILTLFENKTSGVFSIWEVNTDSKEKTRIFEKKLAAGESYRALSYSTSNQRILLQRTTAAGTTHQVMENRENGQIWEVEEPFNLSFQNVVFNPRDHDSLYVSKDKNLYSLNYAAKTMGAVLANNVAYAYSDAGNLYLVQNVEGNYGLWRLEQNNTKTNIIKTLPVSDSYQIKYLPEADSYAVLTVKDKDLFYYTITSGKLVLNKIADKVDWFLASPESKYVAYFKEGSLYCYETEKDHYFQTLKNRAVSSIAWLSDEANIVYIENETLGFVNFNGYYDKFLFKASKALPVYVAPGANNIFYGGINPEKNFLDLYVTSI